ncbi:MAG TPA: FeoA domain-containing protein [Methanocorpusculum sp.]|nr:FeoA domain-containing protein [Methanocorpusculum sp.]
MTTELEEDILESMLAAGEDGVAESELKLEHRADAGDKKKAFTHLAREGYIAACARGWKLIEKGRRKAESIARKHAVLESFLTEILGKNPDAATKEASVLEHSITTETINRIHSMLGQKATGHEKLTAQNPVICLDECPEGSLLHVSMIKEFAKHSRLIDMGIIPGELIELKRKLSNKSVVIRVKGCDIALSPEIASNIMVERCNQK